MSQEDLVRLALEFTDAFNRGDLDAVMACFAEDAVYDEFDGRRHQGVAAIRQAFLPQFRGDFGKVVFETGTCFADSRAGRVLVAWRCTIEGKPGGWRGLDVLHVRNDGKILEKQTYAKARQVLLER